MNKEEEVQALVIEDDPDMALQLRLILERRFRARVETAGDCASAREKMSSRDFDFVTLDFRLPDGEGLSFLEEINNAPDPPPVIMVTGRGDEETAVRSFRLRASGYVVKDARITEMLTEAVEKALADVALKRAELELERYREHLEELVQERTRELNESNEHLQKEIAERMRVEDELRRLNSELEGYSSVVSHDLKAPLTSIKLANETLQRLLGRIEDEQVRKELSRFGEVIEISANKVDSLIEELLSLARAGQEPDEVSDVDVAGVVHSVIEERSAALTEKRISVRVDEELGHVRGNATQIYQVFSNLINNAIKHNTSSDPVIEVRRLERLKGGGGRYLVRDNGPGIPAGDLENIFLPFFKGENGETGIGLAIAEKIVKIYGGDIRAYNDEGACFDFTLRDLGL